MTDLEATIAAGAVPVLPHQVRLVIWDLDDTFWDGMLTEGGARLIDANVALVKALCARGIVSSIASKNDLAEARALLRGAGIWEYFIFPRIAFEPKGPAIAAIIDAANLRPDNVLFIDDLPLNLAEARHFAPGIMTALPSEILPHLLDLPQARGKDDSGLTRLRQYKNLEEKAFDQDGATGSNEDFLRGCDIHLSIDYDIEPEFERVVELINRSNQLNFTKRRIETAEQRAAFRLGLGAFGAHAGIVRVSDRYGDYGIVGFYLTINPDGSNRLADFVFSCRTMNMGIEQYVYDMLKRPAIDIVGPVANGLAMFDRIDWITRDQAGAVAAVAATDDKLVLVGGCDLLQVASYCGANRAEYVNQVEDGVIRHYDDVGFILSDRGAVARSTILAQIPCWSADDALRFDRDLADSRLVIASLWDTLFGQYILTDDGVLVRCSVGQDTLTSYLEAHPDAGFAARCRFLELTLRQKAELIRRSFDRIAALSPNAARRVIVGRNVRTSPHGRDLRRFYNRVCRRYCERTGLFTFLDIDDIVPAAEVIDGTHFSRQGYFRIAGTIGALIGQSPGGIARPVPGQHPRGFADVVARSWIRRRGRLLRGVYGKVMRLPTKLTNGALAL